MKNEFTSWWARVLRIIITSLVFAVYISLIFFSFRGNFQFLLTFEYWSSIVSTTVFSLMLRWLYSDTGLEKELNANKDIKDMEIGKGTQVTIVNKNQLTGLLKEEIDKENTKSKLQAYRTKCDRKINFYREKAFWKLFRKKWLSKWNERKLYIDNPKFNINAIKVQYYRYDIDEMLSSFYKERNSERRYRKTKNAKILGSTKTNILTILGLIFLNALDVLRKDFTQEDLLVLFGQLIAFTINIYTGFNLGRDYIRNDYSSNLSDDYVFLKDKINKWDKLGLVDKAI